MSVLEALINRHRSSVLCSEAVLYTPQTPVIRLLINHRFTLVRLELQVEIKWHKIE